MSESGAPAESWAPGESGGVSEGISEEAKQRFAAAAAAMQQIKKEEKRSKKKDDQVAQIIIRFLDDKQHAHFFLLISRLVARDCPSIFILAVLSLIHDTSRQEVESYLTENGKKSSEEIVGENTALMKGGEMDAETNRDLVEWITRMQLVLSIDPEGILLKLMLDEKNIDGTVLQLTTFVLQEFFTAQERSAPFEKLQPLTASILQTVFEPFVPGVRKALIAKNKDVKKEEDA